MSAMDAAVIQEKARRLRYSLRRRYPGVSVEVDFIDHVAEGFGTYQAWFVSFESTDSHRLIEYGLVPKTVDWESGNCPSEFDGLRCSAHGVNGPSGRVYRFSYHVEVNPFEESRDRALTKKMQRQVERMLRPFVRGVWKPLSRADN